jgi:hypothetical protein
MADATPSPQQRLAEVLQELSQLGFCLPGSLTTRQMRCGNPRCRCKADPPQLHGPYTYWTRKVKGRTIAQLLTPEQLDRYRPWIENNHRLHHLVDQLGTLSIQTAQQAEGWPNK